MRIAGRVCEVAAVILATVKLGVVLIVAAVIFALGMLWPNR